MSEEEREFHSLVAERYPHYQNVALRLAESTMILSERHREKILTMFCGADLLYAYGGEKAEGKPLESLLNNCLETCVFMQYVPSPDRGWSLLQEEVMRLLLDIDGE